MKVLTVSMLSDSSDRFFVRTGPNEVMLYEADANGAVRALIDAPAPLRYVTASIEKFNSGYRLETPIEIAWLAELPGLIGRFEIVTETSARLRLR